MENLAFGPGFQPQNVPSFNEMFEEDKEKDTYCLKTDQLPYRFYSSGFSGMLTLKKICLRVVTKDLAEVMRRKETLASRMECVIVANKKEVRMPVGHMPVVVGSVLYPSDNWLEQGYFIIDGIEKVTKMVENRTRAMHRLLGVSKKATKAITFLPCENVMLKTIVYDKKVNFHVGWEQPAITENVVFSMVGMEKEMVVAIASRWKKDDPIAAHASERLNSERIPPDEAFKTFQSKLHSKYFHLPRDDLFSLFFGTTNPDAIGAYFATAIRSCIIDDLNSRANNFPQVVDSFHFESRRVQDPLIVLKIGVEKELARVMADLKKVADGEVKASMLKKSKKSDLTAKDAVLACIRRKMEATTNAYFPFTKILSSTIFAETYKERIGAKRYHLTCDRLERYNSLSPLLANLEIQVDSNLRRVENFAEAHPSANGYNCVVSTPDDESAGFIKQLAIAAEISTPAPSTDWEIIDEVLSSLFTASYNPNIRHDFPNSTNKFLILHNSFPCGVIDGSQMKTLAHNIRSLRRSGSIHPHTAVREYEKQRCLQVVSDGGRYLEKMFYVTKGKVYDMELIDPGERRSRVVADTPDEINLSTTHLRLTPLARFGINAALIPFSNHNAPVRCIFGSNMAKQALGTMLTENVPQTGLYTSAGFQKPLVRTDLQNLAEFSEHVSGMNLNVLVSKGTEFIEDAVLVNKASLERGLLDAFSVEFVEIDDGVGARPATEDDPVDTRFLSRRSEELEYDENSMILKAGQWIRPASLGNEKVQLAHLVEGYGSGRRIVDNSLKQFQKEDVKVMDSLPRFGTAPARLVLLRPRPVSVGDKLASRHGQKGVVARIVPDYDLPFSPDGIIPDLVFNIHSLPSRMTLGHVFEANAGKVAAMAQDKIDATPFTGDNYETIRQKLENAGMNPDGTEEMRDGINGDILGSMQTGLIYYQRLRHLASCKYFARGASGRVDNIGQPVQGRAFGGGLRIGEMEVDAFKANDEDQVLKTIFELESDGAKSKICSTCNVKLDWCLGGARSCHNCGGMEYRIASIPRSMVGAIDMASVLGAEFRMQVQQSEGRKRMLRQCEMGEMWRNDGEIRL